MYGVLGCHRLNRDPREQMMCRIALGIFIVATISPMLESAHAETADPNGVQVWTQCRSPTDSGYVSAQNLSGCTALIESGQLSTLDRATALAYRGIARMDQNQVEQAVADFVEAHHSDSEIESRLHIVPSNAIGRSHDCGRFYPEEAFRKKQTGEVQVGYVVGKHGEITNVHVVKSSGWPLVDQAAFDCATQFRNTPAMIENTPFVWPGKSLVRFDIHE